MGILTPDSVTKFCDVEKRKLKLSDSVVLDIDVMDSGAILVGLRTQVYEDCEEYHIMQTMYEPTRLGLLSCAMAIIAILDDSLTLDEITQDYGSMSWKSANRELSIFVDLKIYRGLFDFDKRDVLHQIWSTLGDDSIERSADALSGILVALSRV